MIAEEIAASVKHLRVYKEVFIAASPEIVFETILEPHGPLKEMGLTLERRPGGRWFRDTGNDTGHFWGHVQVIKPPKVLEIVGPMMMSYPVAGHIQYKLAEQPGGTLLKFTHQAFGYIPDGLEADVTKGWTELLEELREAAQTKHG